MARAWRGDRGFLLEVDDGGFWRLEGESLEGLHPHTSSLEDDLYTTSYELRGDVLWRIEAVQGPWHEKTSEEAVCHELVPVQDEVLIRSFEARIAAHLAALRRAADVRLAAIDGAESELGQGPEVDRAQELLRNRIHAFGDPLDVLLLQTLVELARAGSPSLSAFAAACRVAAFEPGYWPPWPAAAPLPEEEPLATCHRTLVEAADFQEWADAPNNAMAFRLAAALLAAGT